MPLNNKQIEELFAFTEKKLVRYYDLQVELVDHLASSIEEKMAADKNLPFDVALQQVYKSFGLFGFAKIVQAREHQLQRQYRRQWYAALRQQFNWPMVWQSACLLMVCHLLVLYASLAVLAGTCLLLLFALPLYTTLRARRCRRKKKLLMLHYYPPGNIMAYFASQLLLNRLFYQKVDPLILTAVLFTAVLMLLVNFRMIQQIQKEARRLYPEAFAAG